MSWILDVLVVGIVLLFMVLGMRKGFVATLLELVGVLLSVILAFSLSAPMADWAYTSFVEQPVAQMVDSALVNYTDNAIEQTVDELWQQNETMTYFAGLIGIEKQDVISGAAEYSQEGVDAVSIFVKDSIAKPVATMMVRLILMIILLLIFLIVTKILAKVIGRLFTFSVLGTVNSALGAVLGGAKGLLAAFIVCVIFGTVICASATGFLGFTRENVDQSTLFGSLFGLMNII